jgi:hypothetical protein
MADSPANAGTLRQFRRPAVNQLVMVTVQPNHDAFTDNQSAPPQLLDVSLWISSAGQ